MPISIQKEKMQIAYKGTLHSVSLSDIEYVEADEWRCKIYTNKQEFVCAVRLGALCSQLSQYHILRCHKGFAVNLLRMKNIDSREVTLVSGKRIPVGRSYKLIVADQIVGKMGCPIHELL